MNQADDFRRYIEVEVLSVIKALNKNEGMQDRIRKIALATLELIKPGMMLDELYRNAIKLDDQFSELGPVVIKVIKEYEQKYQQRALSQVSQYIKKGQYDTAQDMVKKVLLYKLNS
ncbi:hypothetical protein M1523_02100 [Patescibacteria group bacterium]|nr:hypothetical protein [Patescibacteria group bacterium]MCL5092004.1 hypothetical protein [Patescibacteria group bacterium]